MRRRPGRSPRRSNLEIVALEARTLLTTFMVTSAADDGSAGTLRAILTAANADAGSTPTVVDFNIPGSGVHTITPLSALPTITRPMTINGYSQPGSAPNSASTTDNAVIEIEIAGEDAGTGTVGLMVNASSTIEGLAIDQFSGNGIVVNTPLPPNVGGSVVEGCFLGTNPSGASGLGNGLSGVALFGVENAVIGGSSPADRDVASGNSGDGVYVDNSGATVLGDFLGIGPLGTALGNSGGGVSEVDGSAQDVIGGASAGDGNVISGNGDSGVAIYDGSVGGLVEGNLIGLGPDGETAVPNLIFGVAIFGETTGVTIGGAQAADRNVISGNGDAADPYDGIEIVGVGTERNAVLGNYIGTDITGEKAVGNFGGGITLYSGASGNRIGGDQPGMGNVISGNGGSGIAFSNTGTDGNSVLGNLIGFDAKESVALGNADSGIDIAQGAADNLIGYDPSTVGSQTISNTIVFNGSGGIEIHDAGTDGNLVSLNSIIENGGGMGIYGGASGNLIGGAPLGNVITDNHGFGIGISGTGTSNNVVFGNALTENLGGGVSLFQQATGNQIGVAGQPANLIYGNAGEGVRIQDVGTTGNVVAANVIGTPNSPLGPDANNGPGVLIEGNASGNQIGGSAAQGNTIENNYGPGVSILSGTGNSVLSNTIQKNIGLPIDLGNNSIYDMHSSNMTGGPHSGPDDLLNYPVLTYASQNGTGDVISGTLNAVASTTYTIQFFTAGSLGDDRNATGSTYIGQTFATTNAAGNATFSAFFPSTLRSAAVSATATTTTTAGKFLDTSEYASDFLVTSLPPTATGSADDYDGDGKDDLANYNPATGVWTIDRSTAGPETVSLGEPNVDVPVPGDYDGDGKTDLAVYRPTTGQWIIQRSTAGPEVINFGEPNVDIPVPGDYDGDGKTDLAVYRPTTGQWIILRSTAGGEVVQFGEPGVDKPVPQDYDGDGKTDIAVYRPTTAQWLILQSTAGPKVVQFGEAGVDEPIPADYDGDGKADIAVFRPTTDQWLIIQSTAGPKVVQFGEPGVDVPVPEDYDGDGKADIAVYRPTTAQWLVLRSTAGPEVVTSGPVNDVAIPTPQVYRYLGSLDQVAAEAIEPDAWVESTPKKKI